MTTILNCPFCEKSFNNRSNLWRHKNICKKNPNIPTDEKIIKNLEQQLEEQKQKYEERIQDLKNQLQQQQSLINLLVLHSQNQQPQQPQQLKQPEKPMFCLKKYLNIKCKDAINIIDFKNNIIIKECFINRCMKEHTKIVITDIIMDNLNNNLYICPIQISCFLLKTVWVKNDNNEWVEDTDKLLINKFLGYMCSFIMQKCLELNNKIQNESKDKNLIKTYRELLHKINKETLEMLECKYTIVYPNLFKILKINKKQFCIEMAEMAEIDED
jgi:hypothetical protein